MTQGIPTFYNWQGLQSTELVSLLYRPNQKLRHNIPSKEVHIGYYLFCENFSKGQLISRL